MFHPERMASRILGMGDVSSLIEDVDKLDEKEAAEAAKKIIENKFDFNDMLTQFAESKNGSD